MAIDLQSDEFMTLLTDALRAGPGSPEWHQAVGVLRASGQNGTGDEYQLLVRAREDLESGKDYRAVRAGPAFTRKVLVGIDEEPGGGARGLPSANLLALMGAGVILAVIVVVAVVLFKNAPPGASDDKQVNQLRSLFFNQEVAAIDFTAGEKDIAPEFKTIGELPLKVNDREKVLRPGTTQPSNGEPRREYRAGALMTAEGIPAKQPFLLDAQLRIDKVSENLVPQVFVSEGPPDEEKGTGARELAWLLRDGQPRVALTDGSVKMSAERAPPLKGSQTLGVRIMMDRETAIVSMVEDARSSSSKPGTERRIYEGPHKLSGDAPRYVGVRFLRRTGSGGDERAGVEKISILKP
jgi:hypothetical protein